MILSHKRLPVLRAATQQWQILRTYRWNGPELFPASRSSSDRCVGGPPCCTCPVGCLQPWRPFFLRSTNQKYHYYLESFWSYCWVSSSFLTPDIFQVYDAPWKAALQALRLLTLHRLQQGDLWEEAVTGRRHRRELGMVLTWNHNHTPSGLPYSTTLKGNIIYFPDTHSSIHQSIFFRKMDGSHKQHHAAYVIIGCHGERSPLSQRRKPIHVNNSIISGWIFMPRQNS